MRTLAAVILVAVTACTASDPGRCARIAGRIEAIETYVATAEQPDPERLRRWALYRDLWDAQCTAGAAE